MEISSNDMVVYQRVLFKLEEPEFVKGSLGARSEKLNHLFRIQMTYTESVGRKALAVESLYLKLVKVRVLATPIAFLADKEDLENKDPR